MPVLRGSIIGTSWQHHLQEETMAEKYGEFWWESFRGFTLTFTQQEAHQIQGKHTVPNLKQRPEAQSKIKTIF